MWLLASRRWLVNGLKKILAAGSRGLPTLGRLVWLGLIVKPYQLLFISKRRRQQLGQLLLPHQSGQQQWLPMILVGLGAVLVLINNLNIRQVNAGDFGQHSLLITLIEDELGVLVEESSLIGTINDTGMVEALRPETEIQESEELAPPVTTDEGSTLIKPHLVTTERGIRRQVEVYLVEAGDTLSAIAAKFGVSVATLLWENRLTSYSVLQPGQKLTILPASGISHRVAKGDTLTKIASRYRVAADKIKEFNNLGDTLVVGEILTIPGGRPYVAPAPTRPSSSLLTTIAPNLSSLTKLLWPAPTRRISQYFSWRHAGVDLTNARGTSIYAAEAGVVQTSGWNRGGYGNYIIIDHGQGLATLYAHNTTNLVTVGERVSRGQPIALMGSTGRSTGPHLHFEVRLSGRRVNPLTYIK